MDVHIAEEILNELGSSLEALETQSAAILQFLKDKKIASDDALAPFLDQAAKASNVRWRAARVRIDRQLSSASKAEEPVEQKASEATQKSQQQTPETTSATDRAGAKEKLDQGGETTASHERKQNEQDREGASSKQPAGKDAA